MPRQRSAPAPARSASAAASRPKPASSSPPPPAPPAAAAASSAPTSPPQSSGGWFSRPAPQPAAPQHAAPPPMAAPPSAGPPVAASSGGGIMSGLIGTVVQGAALGTGTAIAHRAVDAVLGPRTVVHEHQGAPAPAAPVAAAAPPAEGPCAGQVKAFGDCMSKNSGDMAACQWYFDAMQQCKLSSA
ncbi:hypothetical protein VOLCADRAFT_103588 [Volvox carteri f. nagariensis]|uniref:CHCH domain-containing protein n=1 Tax=Volvox carteri f. nagariensis TaxID=3068 RepID=D8TN02_VOLCA|nr:uncharacterized protein VOLCADRAFT_103588 [Volvox carteri f. nagariensis]EFJ51343.1 hypothetical protein VOLCADRAFT_103588 [Volvox carteri f. nagariensis]|eukprot:XP_002947810.1 hypothetical protein VOLCADRAFT_103588 [Volvox carteri f. nagariensis]